MPAVKPCSFARWDSAEPVRSAPNLLYSLRPRGLGTPYVESLSSYVVRLAEAHVVPVWRLILHVRSKVCSGRLSRPSMRYAYPANGLGKGAEVLRQSFEAATGQSDLRPLTLSALEGSVSKLDIFRTTEAWCPSCLEQWRTEGVPIYGPLLWAVRVVTVCPAHAFPLVNRCPHCHSQFTPLRAGAWPGYCSICSRWLGTFDVPLTKDSLDEHPYRLWSSTAVGQVLAAMPDLQRMECQGELIRNLQRCLDQSQGTTRRYLANLAGAADCAFNHWVSGRLKPTLDHLCRLSHQLKLPLLALFTGIPPQWRGPARPRAQVDCRSGTCWAQPAIERKELRRVLSDCLREEPPPSVAEIARRLEFRSDDTLRFREPELCRQIAARRRASGIAVNSAKPIFKNSEGHRLENILRDHLAQEHPRSLKEIASKLGYKSDNAIRARFPELCRAITAKRKLHPGRGKEKVRVALETARAEIPPPSLMQIARRLGFSSEEELLTADPEMCASHRQWRRKWIEEQRDDLRRSIQEWLATEPAPTVTAVCLHFDISSCYFQSRFPDEKAEVVRRATERVRIERELRALLMRNEVFEIVRKLREERTFPSLARVKSKLSQNLAGHTPQLRIIVDDAIAHFGPIMRHRSELGQFA
jgi:AraC-like DNA-binding protein